MRLGMLSQVPIKRGVGRFVVSHCPPTWAGSTSTQAHPRPVFVSQVTATISIAIYQRGHMRLVSVPVLPVAVEHAYDQPTNPSARVAGGARRSCADSMDRDTCVA